jgi:hypothetical protein
VVDLQAQYNIFFIIVNRSKINQQNLIAENISNFDKKKRIAQANEKRLELLMYPPHATHA